MTLLSLLNFYSALKYQLFLAAVSEINFIFDVKKVFK